MHSMTQEKIQKMASEMVGDGKKPNKFFVTVSNKYIYVRDGLGEIYEELNDRIRPGQEESTTEVFDEFDDAMKYYEEVELSIDDSATEVILEDRLTGVIAHRYLTKKIRIDYEEDGYDDTYRFGYRSRK